MAQEGEDVVGGERRHNRRQQLLQPPPKQLTSTRHVNGYLIRVCISTRQDIIKLLDRLLRRLDHRSGCTTVERLHELVHRRKRVESAPVDSNDCSNITKQGRIFFILFYVFKP